MVNYTLYLARTWSVEEIKSSKNSKNEHKYQVTHRLAAVCVFIIQHAFLGEDRT